MNKKSAFKGISYFRSLQDFDCPCQNGGECFAGSCCCPPGFSGPLCTVTSAACFTNPCLNGGTCMVNVLSDTEECVCPEMFAGHLCDLMVAPNRNCQPGYFGPKCKTYCAPQLECGLDNQYYCDEITGERICMFGWTGELCNMPVSNLSYHEPSPNSLCRHGVCVNGVCCCEPGYTGTLCHSKILACLHQPCLNSGKCVDKDNSFTCDCSSGYIGLNCEIRAVSDDYNPVVDTQCSTVLCQNSGTCVPIGTSDFYCHCTERYVGSLCDTYVPKQASNPLCPSLYFDAKCSIRCEERDSCAEGHFYCDSNLGHKICKSGWGGYNCNIRLVSPDVDPACPLGGSRCQNGGSCFNGSCCCTEYYDGELCQSETLPCSRQLPNHEKPCGDHRNCINLDYFNFTCSCDAGLFGPSYQNNRTEVIQSINPILPISTHIEPSSTVATHATASQSTNPPEQCGNFWCYNGGRCYFTSLCRICRCPRENMGRFCETLSDTFTESSSSYVRYLSSSRASAAIPASSSGIATFTRPSTTVIITYDESDLNILSSAPDTAVLSPQSALSDLVSYTELYSPVDAGLSSSALFSSSFRTM